jgi:hypothetical protein
MTPGLVDLPVRQTESGGAHVAPPQKHFALPHVAARGRISVRRTRASARGSEAEGSLGEWKK